VPHVAREQRLVFGEVAELYDSARPSYPAELIDDVVAMVGSHARAVDAGCGTGKATVLLARRGLRGVGVEPDAAMARVACRNLAEFPGWRVDVSNFESWQPDTAASAFDLVVRSRALVRRHFTGPRRQPRALGRSFAPRLGAFAGCAGIA
jgi:SAM-dependent methyltransferase